MDHVAVDNDNQLEQKSAEVGRRYQIALCDLAKEKNCIICLPTGSGKTYIALQLTKYYLPDAVEKGKKIIFLANTVPLVHQQAKYFKDQLFLKNIKNEKQSHVKPITGDMNVDIWDAKKWSTVISNTEILVMTPQILLDALEHGYLALQRIVLLIFDECHHTDKDHPMARIMEKYIRIKESNNDSYDLPRVLGLTATIIKGSVKKKVAEEVVDIERRLSCHAVTYHDYEEVLKHSTKAEVKMVTYSRSPSPHRPPLGVLYRTQQSLDAFAEAYKKFPYRAVNAINHPTFKKTCQIFKKSKTPVDDLQKVLTDVMKIFDEDNLGVYGGRLAATLRRGYLQMFPKENYLTTDLFLTVDTCLARVVNKCDNILAQYDKAQQIRNCVSGKVLKLLEIFQDWDKANAGKEELCGIVFCNERLTAQILSWIFHDAAENCGDLYKFIRPAFVVGNGRTTNDVEEQRITNKKQEETIKKFHSREINLIFATSVLEEGLNVPSCNVVVRFDPILKYPSFVQSMGRARKRGALFCVLSKTENLKANNTLIENFTKFNHELASHLRHHAKHLDEDDADHEPPSESKDDWLIIDPNNPDSPSINLAGAVQIVHRYCNLLSCDRFVKLEPVSWWEEVGTRNNQKIYKAYVRLPSNAAVRDVTDGNEMTSKNDAKRSAFLNVCKKLYANGALDNRLLPRARALPEKVDKFLADLDKQLEFKNEIEDGNKWYRKKVPDKIEKSLVSANTVFIPYIIKLRVTDASSESSEHLKLYDFENKRHTIAILTPVDLNDIPSGCLYSRRATLQYNFERVDLKSGNSLNAQEITLIKNFQTSLFCDYLQIRHPLMSESEKNPLLIVAVVRDGNGDYSINWELLDKLATVDNEIFQRLVCEPERKNAVWSAEDYEDAVVIPWYKGSSVLEMYCICSLSQDLTPESPLDDSDPHSVSLSVYYRNKYNLNVTKPDKPLLIAASLGKQLNYLTTKRDPTKLSKEERKDNRYASSIQVLIPEFVKIHPMPSSIFVLAKFLPSILHRTSRLMLAREIQVSIAQSFDWKASLTHNGGREDISGGPERPNRNGVIEEKDQAMTVRKETMHMLSLANFGQLEATSGIPQRVPLQEKPCKHENEEMEVEHRLSHLDFVHPDKITLEDIKDHMDWKRARKPVIANSKSKKKVILLEDLQEALAAISSANFGKSLDAKTDFRTVKGPSCDAIMEAITLSNAQDAISLESLEVIGDSFLKFIVTTHIFCELQTEDEGTLTRLRTKLVCNEHLNVIGTKKNLDEYLSGGIFVPKHAWLPPGLQLPPAAIEATVRLGKNYDVFSAVSRKDIEGMSVDALVEKVRNSEYVNLIQTPEHVSFTHTRLKDKRVADCTEAMIGVYYMNSGIDGALRCMEWLGLRAPYASGEIGPYRRCNYTRELHLKSSVNGDIEKPEQLLPLIGELEELIGYKFEDRWLAVEAFSHPGYLRNTVTGCYQRLEFLGDAVLDFLVTDHIYKNGLAKSPGALTDLRSALVNNVTFGSLTVRYGFHKFLLSIAKQLQDAIDKFTSHQAGNNHAVTGHFILLNDLECPVAEDVEVPKVLGDLFESLAGAVFLDSGLSLDTTWKVFYRLMKKEIDEFSRSPPMAPTRELYEKFTGIAFKYQIDNGDGNSNFDGYAIASVKIRDKVYYGRGTNKKQAKQAAAKYALRCIKNEAGS